MSGRFEDDRGVIHDVLGPVDSVTRISTLEGKVRGNHVHNETTQWTLVLAGRLLMVTGSIRHELGPGEFAVTRPGTPHAWKALEDTDCLVFTRGPRSGAGYESDTSRLEEPLL